MHELRQMVLADEREVVRIVDKYPRVRLTRRLIEFAKLDCHIKQAFVIREVTMVTPYVDPMGHLADTIGFDELRCV